MSKYKDLYKTDSRFQPELAGFQDSHTNFCVIKDFRKRGSAVWGWIKNKNPEEKTSLLRSDSREVPPIFSPSGRTFLPAFRSLRRLQVAVSPI